MSPVSERRLLEPDEVSAAVQRLEGWTVVGGQLHRELRFGSFAEAFGFMTTVAIHAQAMDHHPDWSNAYTRVIVDLSTHDLGGISTRDVELAERIDAAARKRS